MRLDSTTAYDLPRAVRESNLTDQLPELSGEISKRMESVVGYLAARHFVVNLGMTRFDPDGLVEYIGVVCSCRFSGIGFSDQRSGG